MKSLLIFCKENRYSIILLLVCNGLFIWMTYYVEGLDSELNFKYAVHQSNSSSLINERNIEYEIINLFSLNTKNSIKILNSRDIKGNPESEAYLDGIKNDFNAGKISHNSYWESVIMYLKNDISSKTVAMNNDNQELIELYDKSNFWGTVILISNLILLPINIFLSIHVSRKWEKLFE